ncbi:hypothetical protein NP233_g12066 [Leucocoprinus birnbaumii]|uniref:Carbohydrate kinase PfkB domain-containing protein n=1 Tax=Leucocoprinus birnbaumii TaxID=56174 RepID=A0AAD5VFN0_9AGAR|nr:hypothetical protein NP233_g12066 [Leucocoprinus birnbaumii]
MSNQHGPQFVSLAMFNIDEFEYKDADGNLTGRIAKSQIGGAGTYAVIGARMWLAPDNVGMIVDKGYDFPTEIQEEMLRYGEAMWAFREQPHHRTTRILNSFYGERTEFKFLTDRIWLTPRDLDNTRLSRPHSLHFISSPERAKRILTEVKAAADWNPTIIYEPVPVDCTPEFLPGLQEILPFIDVLSPNAEEALQLLSLPLPPTKATIEQAACMFLAIGVGTSSYGVVIIRSGQLGAFALSPKDEKGIWIDAYWTEGEGDLRHVVDVTGAGNSFLGGLAAGLYLTKGDIYEGKSHRKFSSSAFSQ